VLLSIAARLASCDSPLVPFAGGRIDGCDGVANGHYSAVIVEGSFTSVEEQMPGTYAQKFADYGESAGEPRQLEAPSDHLPRDHRPERIECNLPGCGRLRPRADRESNARRQHPRAHLPAHPACLSPPRTANSLGTRPTPVRRGAANGQQTPRRPLLSHAEPPHETAKRRMNRAISCAPSPTSRPSKRSVTPEVAGSSPVAPALKVPAYGPFCVAYDSAAGLRGPFAAQT